MELNLTDLEKDVLKNGLYDSNFNDTYVDYVEEVGEYGNSYKQTLIVVWADSVIETCKETKLNQLSGVISSLSKKGLVECNGRGRDATVTVTKEGYQILKTLL